MWSIFFVISHDLLSVLLGRDSHSAIFVNDDASSVNHLFKEASSILILVSHRLDIKQLSLCLVDLLVLGLHGLLLSSQLHFKVSDTLVFIVHGFVSHFLL